VTASTPACRCGRGLHLVAKAVGRPQSSPRGRSHPGLIGSLDLTGSFDLTGHVDLIGKSGLTGLPSPAWSGWSQGPSRFRISTADDQRAVALAPSGLCSRYGCPAGRCPISGSLGFPIGWHSLSLLLQIVLNPYWLSGPYWWSGAASPSGPDHCFRRRQFPERSCGRFQRETG